MLNQAFYPHFEAVLLEIEALLSEQQQDLYHYRLLQRALGKLRQDFMRDKIFPALSVPLLAWQALGQTAEAPINVLNAAHFLFYAFLDLTDDVEDRELEGAIWQQVGEPLAINAGTSLLFLSLLMLERLNGCGVPVGVSQQLRQQFIQAGWVLTVGQHRDLASSRYEGQFSPEDVLQTHSLKSGTSVALYLETPATLAQAEPQVQALLAALGRELGVMAQIRGDWYNLQASWSSDFANGCQSLPLVLLQQALQAAQDAETWTVLRQRAGDPVAHDLMRHALKKHQLVSLLNPYLASYSQQAEQHLQALEQAGCQCGELSKFLRRLNQPLSP